MNKQDAAVLLLKSSTASDARRSSSMNSWIGEGPQRSLPYVNPEAALCTEVAKLGIDRPFEFELKSAKGPTPVSSLHPSRPSFDDLQKALKHALEVTPSDQRTAKAKALARDNYRCIVTGWYDMDSVEIFLKHKPIYFLPPQIKVL
ncbi:hypothetical protein K503DRAFT_800769 [Rhizopogon vinicolor AM-OR11-026]|uniref:Uncharacterized protein n=1 Tax=Rhizopogon vinicolor AM-OR11-026 TaxID=1314800 RepID=A0A1B7MZJ2_9AGAM|nr:hypothetical protein K503DRAFT_800769 [Rhizopogon vinicolor AM-OR11-026]